MEDFQTIDLPHEIGEEVTLTIWFRDSHDFDEVDCVAYRGSIRIGNWGAALNRTELRQMIGPERVKAYEDERAALLEMQGVAA